MLGRSGLFGLQQLKLYPILNQGFLLKSFSNTSPLNNSATTLNFDVRSKSGALTDCFQVFKTSNVDLKHIECCPLNDSNKVQFSVCFEQELKEQQLQKLLGQLKKFSENVSVADSKKLNGSRADNPLWFPKHIAELDQFANRILSYGAELDADHPGFKDATYRERRKYFADIAVNHKHGQQIPKVQYTAKEIETWRTIYNKLKQLYPDYACMEYNKAFELCKKFCGYSPNNIPQLQDISDFLKSRTGFTLRPVAGLLSSRDFLAGLAFRVFHCTQYMRHYSVPMYTPEPDACHELLGHVPLFADPDFAKFSQQFGIISLGASDEVINQLGTLYWFTVEFGLCLENGQKKVYGAGLLSSFGEIQHALSNKAVIEPFDPDVVANTKYPITEFQPKYFIVESFQDAKAQLIKWAKLANRHGYELRYNSKTQSIESINCESQTS